MRLQFRLLGNEVQAVSDYLFGWGDSWSIASERDKSRIQIFESNIQLW